jgi:menaquinol-cytochrome c reductase iron-sulfur subunit
VADDRRQTKSKYTADRMIPGAFEGETVTRRRFMTVSANAAGAVAASAFLLPALGFALGPVFEEHKVRWQDVGPVEDFSEDTYVPVTLVIVEGIGEAGRTLAYVRKRNPQIDTDKLPKGFEYGQYLYPSRPSVRKLGEGQP